MTSYLTTTHSTSFDFVPSQREWEEIIACHHPAGLRHEMGWLCAHKILRLAQRMDQKIKSGSWHALAAKKQWIEARLSTQALKNVMKMTQRLIQPADADLHPAWNEAERQSLQAALSDIQGELTLEERAWIEADTAEFLASDAISRLLWSSIQLIPPTLSQIVRTTQYITRYLHAAYTWKHHSHTDWEKSLQIVQDLLQQKEAELQQWLQQQWSHAVSQHHQAQTALLSLFQKRRGQLEEQEAHWQAHWEDVLY